MSDDKPEMMGNMRPMYETPEDQIREAQAALAFLHFYNERHDLDCYAEKIAIKGRMINAPDFKIRREGTDELVALCEVKCRHAPYDFDYVKSLGGPCLSKKQYDMVMQYHDKYPAIFLHRLTDKWLWYTGNDPVTEWAGFKKKKSSGDPYENAPQVVFPANLMEKRIYYTEEKK